MEQRWIIKVLAVGKSSTGFSTGKILQWRSENGEELR
jgi:hypothetical protein